MEGRGNIRGVGIEARVWRSARASLTLIQGIDPGFCHELCGDGILVYVKLIWMPRLTLEIMRILEVWEHTLIV